MDVKVARQRAAAPTWEETFARYGSEEILAAKALIEISPALLRDARRYLDWSPTDGYRDAGGVWHASPRFRGDQWLGSVDDVGRGWSSTEWRLFRIVECLLDPRRSLSLVGVLDGLGSWEAPAWRILVCWGSGGNNRDHPGRLALSAA